VEINPGESRVIFLTVINNENYSQNVKPEFQTYTSHDDSGYPIARNISDNDPRNIKSWIKFENDVVQVGPNSEKKVKAIITAPENSEPGGKYGALIYGPVLSNNSGVSFRTRVASLLLVTVKGNEEFDGEVLNFGLKNNHLFSDKKVNFVVDFKNNGNIHTSPKGTISVYDSGDEKILSIFSILDKNGKEVGLNDIPVNPYFNYVLPGIKREYSGQ
jgi:hypothetical protein